MATRPLYPKPFFTSGEPMAAAPTEQRGQVAKVATAWLPEPAGGGSGAGVTGGGGGNGGPGWSASGSGAKMSGFRPVATGSHRDVAVHTAVSDGSHRVRGSPHSPAPPRRRRHHQFYLARVTNPHRPGRRPSLQLPQRSPRGLADPHGLCAVHGGGRRGRSPQQGRLPSRARSVCHVGVQHRPRPQVALTISGPDASRYRLGPRFAGCWRSLPHWSNPALPWVHRIPATGVLTLSGFAPTITTNANPAPGVGSLTLTGKQPPSRYRLLRLRDADPHGPRSVCRPVRQLLVSSRQSATMAQLQLRSTTS